MMKGLDLSEKFYRDEIQQLIEKHFPKLAGKYAAGLISSGSDVLEYDDELSRHRDWGPRCQIWLDDSDYRKYSKSLHQLFTEKIPRVFLGFGTNFLWDELSQAFIPAKIEEEGIHLITITTVKRYLKDQFGLYTCSPNLLDWLYLPEQKLLELTRGRIFYDSSGDITRVRKDFAYFPKDIRCYKLLYIWESLEHHFETVKRCILRGDVLSARIILGRIVELMVRLVFLFNYRYCPGTMKWFSREFYNLPRFADETGPQLEEALILADIKSSYRILENTIISLIKEFNQLEFSNELKFDFSQFSKSINFPLQNIIKALRERLPLEFKNLTITKANEPWITNDIMFMKFEQNNNHTNILNTSN